MPPEPVPSRSERVEAVRKLVAIASGDWSDPSKRPTEDPYGTCDWGDCDVFADHWRWAEEHGGWLPVCSSHKGEDDA